MRVHLVLAAGAAVFSGVLAPAPLHADTLVFANGARLEGVVQKTKDGYLLETPAGWSRFSKSAVLDVIVGKSQLQEYRDRRAVLEKSDLEGHVTLARFAQNAGLEKEAKELYGRVVELQPDNTEGRAALGYQQFNGQWVTRETMLTQLGMVQVGSEWATPTLARQMDDQKDQVAQLSARLNRLESQNERLAYGLEAVQGRRTEATDQLAVQLSQAQTQITKLQQDLKDESNSRKRTYLTYGASYVPFYNNTGKPVVWPPPRKGPLIISNPLARNPYVPR